MLKPYISSCLEDLLATTWWPLEAIQPSPPRAKIRLPLLSLDGSLTTVGLPGLQGPLLTDESSVPPTSAAYTSPGATTTVVLTRFPPAPG
jgi:hypothetical protein